ARDRGARRRRRVVRPGRAARVSGRPAAGGGRRGALDRIGGSGDMKTALADDDTAPTDSGEIADTIASVVDEVRRRATAAWAGATTTGARRRRNEDRWAAFGGTVVVADGMGGRHGGVLASSTAVDEYL